MEEKKPKAFRKRGKLLCLTWSQKNVKSADFDFKEHIRDMLIDRLKGNAIRRWVVARELHKSGAVHYHAGIETVDKFDIADIKKTFRFKKEGLNYDPSCSKESTPTFEGWGWYCIK